MSDRLRVTDHAVLRYLERAGGFEIERLRGEMTRRLSEAWRDGSPLVQLDGFQFVVRRDKDGPVVATVLTPRPKTRPRHHREDDDV